jgi:hypothetical protein
MKRSGGYRQAVGAYSLAFPGSAIDPVNYGMFPLSIDRLEPPDKGASDDATFTDWITFPNT